MRVIGMIILLSVCGFVVKAQSFSASHNASVQVNKISNINITSTNSVSVANTIDYDAGTSVTNFWTIQVDANSSWQVTINASTANFSPTTVNTIPISVLSFKKNGALNWTTLTTTAQVLATGSKGDNTTSGNSFGVDLKIVPTYNYEPGTYTLSIVFTSTAL